MGRFSLQVEIERQGYLLRRKLQGARADWNAKMSKLKKYGEANAIVQRPRNEIQLDIHTHSGSSAATGAVRVLSGRTPT